MISFEGVQKILSGRVVIDHITLRLEAGKTHVLIGESGCGKSTLLRLASGLIAPTAGHVRLDGRRSITIPDPEKAKVFGYMVQEGGLFPHLTCAQNVMLPANVHGVVSGTQYQRLCELTSLSEEILKRYPRHISGGQRQRVALMRALILDPPILFLDEPLGALDPIVRRGLQDDLRAIFRQLKKTVVIVTHDLHEADFFGDTVTLLNQGRVEDPKSEYATAYFNAQRGSGQ